MRFCVRIFHDIPIYLKSFFIDLRLVSILMCIWLTTVIAIMVEIGIFSNNQFVAFGPRPELSFMKVPIDTYYKYNMLITMIILHTFITDFIADSLAPHVLNVVQDPKTKHIPHKPCTYISITTIWAFYSSVTQLFAIFIAFAQLDLLLVRLASDILANMVTTSLYLQGKEYKPINKNTLDNNHNMELEGEDEEEGTITSGKAFLLKAIKSVPPTDDVEDSSSVNSQQMLLSNSYTSQ